ncbi:MAG: hypothetical protein NTV32_03965 [Gammaproteobacteria bacterium]|nr:hypothetical protein [Gammaproteobacteria bacterium]
MKFTKTSLPGLPLALLMDHGGVLDGAALSGRVPSGHIVTGQYFDDEENCTILTQSISRTVIENLIQLRASGVKLWSMSNNDFQDQIDLIELIQKAYPAFKFDVLWQAGEAGSSTKMTTSTTTACDQVLIIAPRADGSNIRGDGKDGIREAYVTAGLMTSEQKSLIVVLDDGPTIIKKADGEGYLTTTFSDRTAEAAFQEFFEITCFPRIGVVSESARTAAAGGGSAAPVSQRTAPGTATPMRDLAAERTPLLEKEKSAKSCCVVM